MRKFLALFFLGCFGSFFEITFAAGLISITGRGIIDRSGAERDFFQKERAKNERIWKDLITKEELFQEYLRSFKEKQGEEEFFERNVSEELLKERSMFKLLSHYDTFQIEMRQSREKMEEKIRFSGNPDKMAQKRKKVSSPKIRKKEWEKNEDKIGGFRFKTSLRKIIQAKNQKKSKKSIFTLRKSALFQRWKYGEVQFSD
ncbi:hypothetical protein KAI58_04015 [Candidatus Gracilibacteria bacterium]|nr:hypothetical protein [Candidatus Gracilibacteria bacterium]